MTGWTPLVIRQLMVGAGGFNEIHRGIPRISRTMLAQRLRLLERRGLVRREPGARGRPGDQQLGTLTWCLDQALRAAGSAPAYLLTGSSCSGWRR